MNLYDIVAPMSIEEAKAKKQRLDAKCWKGYKKSGTKVKGGVRVNNCVPMESRACPVCGQTPCNCTHVVAEDSWHGETDAWHAGDNAWSSDQHEMVEARLTVGDPVIVTAPNEFEGKTGEIAEFSPSGAFVIVNLYNYGEHSMHLSDVEYNQYADEEDEVDEGYQDFNKVEPYEVCLAGKPVKTFDYYEDARRFHDNWKKKLYAQGEQAKADKITLNPVMKEAGNPAQQAAVAIAMKKAGKKPKHTDEALSRKDLVKQVGDKLNDPEFRKKPADPTKRWEKGDLYQGPGPDDYGYTGYQGHGMPRDNPKKKKGVAEVATDYSKRRERERDIDAGKPVAKQRQSKMTDYQKRRAQQKKELELGESTNYWTRLQNERNTRLNSLVNELNESIK